MPLSISTATGLRSLASTSQPKRRASKGMDPPPAKGSSSLGGLPSLQSRMRWRAPLQQLDPGETAPPVILGPHHPLRVTHSIPTSEVSHLPQQCLPLSFAIRVVH